MKKIIIGIVLFVSLAFGFYLDAQSQLTQALLEFSFYSAGILGLLAVSLIFMLKKPALWRSILHILLAFIIWRVSFFPIMVLAGFVTTWGEHLMILIFNKSIIYPFLLLFVAVMNALILSLALWLVESIVNLLNSSKQQQPYWSLASVMMITLPLASIAFMISFTKPVDWHTIPDTSFIDNKPLPVPSLPEMNPYSVAFENNNLSLSHQVLFKAAAITYDWIPEDTEWSQVVKGVLEKEFLTTKNVSTSFCSKIHYRAFMTAHPFIKQQSIDDLDDG